MQIGSVFEYVNQKPVFGVLGSDSIFYAPVLGFFAVTGIPSSVTLFAAHVFSHLYESEITMESNFQLHDRPINLGCILTKTMVKFDSFSVFPGRATCSEISYF